MFKAKVFLLTFMASLCSMELFASNIPWQNGQEKIKEFQEEKHNKNTFILFTAPSWCSWCERLEAEFLKQDEFENELHEAYNFIRLEFPKPSEIRTKRELMEILDQYEVKGFPTILIYNKEHKEIARWNFPRMSVHEWVSKLKALSEK